MSTKTNFKRVALVAVAALGLGVLTSVAPANAAAGAFTDFATTQSCSAKDSSLATVALTGNVRYLTVALGSAIVVEPSDAAQILVISENANWVSGHPLQTADNDATEVTFDSATVVSVLDDIDATDTVVARANAIGTFTIKSYDDAADSTAADTVTVTVVAKCDNGTFSAVDSFVELQETSGTADDSVDDTSVWADGSEAYLAILAKNSYGNNLPTGVFTASVTNGGYVDIASGATPEVSATSSSSDSVAAAGDDIRVSVYQAEDYKAFSGVLTVSYNGVEIAKKSILITGDLAKIVVSSVITAKTGVQNFKAFKSYAYDNAGNQIAWADAKLTVTGTDQNITAADAGAATATDATYLTNTVTCPTGAKGTSTLKVRGLTNQLTFVESPEFKVSCASTPYTWSVSMDKASYVPGDIATVTISAKDVNGATVFDPNDTNNTGDTPDTFSYVYGSAGTAPTVTGSNLTAVVAPAAADYFVGGVKKYSFTVGSTEGDYNLTVSLAGITTDAAKTVKYSIKSSASTVSNADVLKAIVSLIASINKQIAALQKALLKK